MDIKVDRVSNEKGDLVFTITVSKSHFPNVSEEEISALVAMDAFTKTLGTTIDPEKKLYQDILAANKTVKEKIFQKILSSLKFSIKNQLQPKFDPICQEIYNWIYDAQRSFLKSWMTEFDPQRTTYFFDNDEQMKFQFLNEDYPVDKDPEDDEQDSDEDDDND